MNNKKKIRDRLWRENEEICAHCGHRIYADYNKTVDHFIPKSCFGSLDSRNLFPVCRRCNKERGNELVGIDFYPYIAEYKKKLALEYGKEYNSRVNSMA